MLSSPTSGVGRPLVLVLALSIAAVAAACSDSGDPDGGDGGGGADAGPPAADPTVVASTLEADLTAAGIDAANPPPWATVREIWESKLPEGQMAVLAAAKPLMDLFAKSLGVQCDECHSDPNYVVPDARKNLVAGMWDAWVRGLRLKEGGLLFCDSCHQGKTEFLARDDREALASWMQVNFVNNLTRVDGQPESCASCHGLPFEGQFLGKWEEGQYPSAP
jgi:hypothetical protein